MVKTEQEIKEIIERYKKEELKKHSLRHQKVFKMAHMEDIRGKIAI